MATQKKVIINSEDAISNMPHLKTQSSKILIKKSVESDLNTGNVNIKSNAEIQKKPVNDKLNTFIIPDEKTIKKNGLKNVTIETDNSDKKIKTNFDKHDITETTIETDTLSPAFTRDQSKYPVIIDETGDYEDGKDSLLQQENSSNDLSSELYNQILPSESDQHKVGTGKVVGILGSGGMARVYKTWNEKLEIFRAVKVLLPNNQKEHLDRFLTEAKITVKLHHPNIVETYDTGEWHGLPFMEMELIEGDTLNILISRYNRLPSPVCSAIALEVSKALAYAHSQEIMIYGKVYKGIIHRDLKPSNIMITSSGIVKLMDFGVARPIETGLHTVTNDRVVGTIHYFAPEQIRGFSGDPLSDVYSFGAVLYEMLCGKNPFPQTNMVNLIQEKTHNHFRPIEDFQLNVDCRLATVTQTCLKTDKRERFENFNIIRKNLEEIHNSYRMGTPEEVIASFYQDHKKIQLKFERFYNGWEKDQVELSVEQPIIQETVEDSNKIEKVKQISSVHNLKNDSWEKKSNAHRIRIVIAVVIILAAAVAGNIVTNGKYLKARIISEMYQKVLNFVMNKIITQNAENRIDEIILNANHDIGEGASSGNQDIKDKIQKSGENIQKEKDRDKPE